MRLKGIRVVLFVLAMAIQVIAPVTGGMSFAHERSRGETVSLCRSSPGGAGDAPSLPAHHDRCALCQITCDGVAPVTARDYSIVPAGVVWFTIDRTRHDFVLPATSTGVSLRARAPPAFS